MKKILLTLTVMLASVATYAQHGSWYRNYSA